MEIKDLLLIDDDSLYTMLMEEVFSEINGISYCIHNHPLIALSYLKDCEKRNSFPDLILVDLKMPEIDGFQFIEHYEKMFWQKFSSTILMVVTSSVSRKDKQQVLAYPSVSGILNKPLTEDKLLEVLSERYSEKKIVEE
jgi:CheY-like chemotaxis protein